MSLSKSEREFHRKVGTRCFNDAWGYLAKPHRTALDDQRLLHLVHTSHFHWGLVGTPRQRAIADWQVSRAYATLGHPRLALPFAQASLDLCQTHQLSDLLSTAYEAMARAYAVARNTPLAREYLRKARDQLSASSVDDESWKIYLGQIRETERLIRRKRG